VRQLVPAPPILGAKAYVLIDAKTADVLVEKNGYMQLPPASLTKLMTSYLVSKQLNEGKLRLDDLVPISVKAWKSEGSKMFAKVHDKISINNLLHGIIIQSGNDASIAMAEYISGSEDVFAHLMNQEARKLGMKNTNFKNATGLPSPFDKTYLTKDEHYSSAYDLALLSKAIIDEDKDYYYLYSEKKFSWNNITQTNRNTLLWEDSSIDGLKTGKTDAAGYCLAASAKRGDQRFIAVILNSKGKKARSEEMQKLLNYGFQFYSNYQVTKAGAIRQKEVVFKGKDDFLAVGTAKDLVLTLVKGQQEYLVVESIVDKTLVAPIKKGDVVGILRVKYNNEILKQVYLVALNDAEQGSFFKRLFDGTKLWWKGLFS